MMLTLLLTALLVVPAPAAQLPIGPARPDSVATAPTAPAVPPASAAAPAQAPPRTSGYRPRHVLLQTGGGVGMVSVGGGLSFARHRLDVDGLLGYVPARHADKTLTIATLKLKYVPWQLPLGGSGLDLTPLAVGVYGSYTFGVRNPGESGQYPDDYYWFSRNMRVGPVLGSSLSYALPATPDGRARRLAAYYELATNDLYALSYVLNRRALALSDIATLALGLKLEF